MRTKTLVTLQDIVDNTNIASNVEFKKIRSSVLIAQDLYIQGLLGSELFDFIYSKRTDQGTYTGLTATQTTFVNDYLTPTIIYYTLGVFCKLHRVEINNIGLLTNNNESSTSITQEEGDKLSLQNMEYAGFYSTRLRTWICDKQNNNDTDPMFALFIEDDQNLEPSDTTNESPIYFPSGREACGCSLYNCNCNR